MEIVKEVLTQAFDVNLSYVFLMDVVLAFMYLFNILLGTIYGTKQDGFDLKKFLFGFLKAISILLIIFGICYILNVFTLTINRLEDISINIEMVSTLELLAIMIAQGIDITKEVFEKIKSFRDLKYISYEDIALGDDSVNDPEEMKG